MSITFNGSFSTTPSTLQDGVADPTSNLLYVVESTGPSIKKCDLVAMTVLASAICLGTPGAICLINSASAVIASTGVTTVDFIEIATLYRTNSAGGATLNGADRNQRIAADTSLGIAFYVSSTANTLVKIVASTQTVSTVLLPGESSCIFRSIILKAPGRWLVGGKFGKVYEIDSTGTIVDELIVTMDPNSGVLGSSSSSVLTLTNINSMSYDNNLLFISTGETHSLYDYSTKTKLWQVFVSGANQDPWSILCASASGESIYSVSKISGADNTTIQEIDFTVGPVQTRDVLFTDATNVVVSTGFCNGYGFALQRTSEKVRVFNVAPRASTTRVFTVNPGGVDQKFRLILIDDTGGVGAAKIILDTFAQSPATYRVPTGKTIIELIKVGDGSNAQWDESRYTT